MPQPPRPYVDPPCGGSSASFIGTGALVIRAFGAHVESRRGAVAERPDFAGRRGPPAISDHRSSEASPWDQARATARSGLGFSGRRPRWPASSASCAQSALAPAAIEPARGGNPHDGEIFTHAPNLMWGTDGVRCSRSDDGWVSRMERRVRPGDVCKRGDRLHPPCSRSPTCPMARPRPDRLGGWPGWIHGSQFCRHFTRSTVAPAAKFGLPTNGAERFSLNDPQHRGAAGSAT